MPINNIPGVGPTNADIATAVAAPSAATIAAAVAAPSSSTIASAVAAAVPTLTQINSSVASNAPSPNAWTVISTFSPNATTNTYTFSGLSGYKVYRLIFNTALNTQAACYMRFNGDTSAVYGYAWNGNYGSNVAATNAFTDSYFSLGNVIDSNIVGDITIYDATLATNKVAKGSISYRFGGNSAIVPQWVGQWRNTSALTSITFFMTGSNFNTGNITLLGAN